MILNSILLVGSGTDDRVNVMLRGSGARESAGTIDSTWNDYGCNKCEDCISNDGYTMTAEQEMEEAAWSNDQDIQKQ